MEARTARMHEMRGLRQGSIGSPPRVSVTETRTSLLGYVR